LNADVDNVLHDWSDVTLGAPSAAQENQMAAERAMEALHSRYATEICELREEVSLLRAQNAKLVTELELLRRESSVMGLGDPATANGAHRSSQESFDIVDTVDAAKTVALASQSSARIPVADRSDSKEEDDDWSNWMR
jgi:hypothetical protein